MKLEPFNLEKAEADKEPRPPGRIACGHIRAMRADTEDHELWLTKFGPSNVYLLACDDCTGPMTEKALAYTRSGGGQFTLEWRRPYEMTTESTLVARLAAGEEIDVVSERMKKAMPTLQGKAAKQFKN